jgi:hypothetical protein
MLRAGDTGKAIALRRGGQGLMNRIWRYRAPQTVHDDGAAIALKDGPPSGIFTGDPGE